MRLEILNFYYIFTIYITIPFIAFSVQNVAVAYSEWRQCRCVNRASKRYNAVSRCHFHPCRSPPLSTLANSAWPSAAMERQMKSVTPCVATPVWRGNDTVVVTSTKCVCNLYYISYIITDINVSHFNIKKVNSKKSNRVFSFANFCWFRSVYNTC